MACSAAIDAPSYRYRNFRLERMLPGMGLLLDAYAIVDSGVAEALAHGGQKPACGTNCYQCCLQPIPATTLEILGLRMFMHPEFAQELEPKTRQALIASFAQFRGGAASIGAACPFLYKGCCAVYPVRPLACRRFIVFGNPCQQGEDPTHTRPQQVLQPGQDLLQAALRLTLPWYQGQYPLPAKPSAVESQAFFRNVTTVLQAVPWAKYAH